MISGIVIHGDSIGKSQGWPTANIDVSTHKIHFVSGVYAANVVLKNQTYNAALIVVDNPYKIETYLLGYDGGDFYGEVINIQPVQKVSEVISVESEDELKEKIVNDLASIALVLNH